MSKLLKIILWLCIAVITLVLVYAIYFLISYHRISDNQVLEVIDNSSLRPKIGEPYTIMSWNIGFGAYESDYDFFMDGGKQSWAKSKESLDRNLEKISSFSLKENANFYIFQEVDKNSTRSYHVDQRPYFTNKLTNYSYNYALNWDSPFIIIPLYQPHGRSVAGLLTFSSFDIESALRRSLPIEDSFMKFVDLDRCYSLSRIPVENEKELVLINLHLSAYTSDGKIAYEQLKMVLEQMQVEYEKGNYCIAGGDFNKDLHGSGSKAFGISESHYNWAQSIPSSTFDGFNVKLVATYDENNAVPSCRNADSAYHENQYQVLIDGFLISDNVQVLESLVLDTHFEYSDHNPVKMTFVLK